ncbi:MAG: hypothetical protein AAF927_18715 [Bacteroidota bacterium]
MEVLDEYLRSALGEKYGGKLKIKQIIHEEERILVRGAFKDASLALGGESTFASYLSQRQKEYSLYEFCYYAYEASSNRKSLRCLEGKTEIDLAP